MEHYLKEELYELIRTDEQIFEFLQRGSLDGLWYWDLENPENEWMNARFWEVLGYNPADMPALASAWQGIINKDDLKLALENLNKHIADPNYNYDQEVRYKHKNGNTVWIRCRGIAIRDKAGKPLRMLGIHQDITELKKSEERLKFLNKAITELITIEDQNEVYRYFTKSVHSVYTNSVVLYVSINEQKKDTRLESVSGLDNSLFEKIIKISGGKLEGRHFRLTEKHQEIFCTGKFYQHKGGLADFSEGEFPEVAANLIQNLININHIYTIGVNRKNKLLGVLHIFTLNNTEIADGGFLETYTAHFSSVIESLNYKNKVKTSEDKFQKAMNATHDIIWDWDVPTGDVFYGPAWFKIFGYESDEFAQNISAWEKLIYPPDKDSVMAQDKACINNETDKLEIEYRMIAKDGSIKWILDRGEVIERDKNGIATRIVGAISDITERKEAEQLLIESKNKYESLVESSPNMILTHTLDGTITFVNKNGADFVNSPPEAIVGLKITDIFPANENEVKENIIKLLGNKEATFKTKYELDVSGKMRTIELSGVPILKDNQAHEILIHASDITERTQAEASIRESEEKFRTIFENSPIMIDSFDKNGKCTLWNKECVNKLGYTIDEINEADDPFALFYPDDEVRAEVIKTVIAEPDNIFREWTPVTKDGKKLPSLWANFRVSDNLVISIGVDISERKQAEHRIQEKNEQFETIIVGSNLGWWDWNLISGKWKFNDILAENLGYTPDEISHDSNWWDDKIHPDDRDKLALNKQKHYEGETEFFESKLRLKTKSGSWKWFYDHGKVVERNSDGKPVRMTGTIRDIDDEEKAKEKLNASLQQLQVINANNPTIIWKWEIDDNIKFKNAYISEAVDALLSLPNGSIGNSMEKYFSFILPQYIPEITELIADFVNNIDKPTSFEYEVKKADGTIAWFSSTAKVVHENGRLTIYGTTIDITQRKLAAEALMESERKRNIWINNSPVCTKVLDLDFNLQFMSSSGIRALKIKDINEFYGKPYPLHFYPESFKKETRKQLQKIKETLEAITFEAPIHDLNGNTIWYQSTIMPVNDSEGELDYLLIVSIDITQRKKFESEIIKAKEKAEESDKLKSAFLANMSHEIRTPMNGILGFTQLLNQPNLSGEKQQKFINIIRKSSTRMLNTVNDIIDISKIDAGLVEISNVTVDIIEEIETQYEFFSGEAKAKGLDFHFINKTAGDILINTDKLKLQSILSNLIKNAIKYTDSGVIEIICDKNEDNLEIKVVDTGIGISQDRIKSIFNRFEQADISDEHARQGSGLGLSITEAYVEMLGGTISVESELADLPAGKSGGSTFIFTLPCAKSETDRNLIKKKESKPLKTRNKEHNILIAEDDDISYEYLRILLVDKVRNILRAKNGKEAIKILMENQDIDLILMDVKMPVMDGYEATKEIRKFNKDVKIIAQTAYALEGDEEKAIDVGCDSYISKPIISSELDDLLEEYLKS